MKTKEEIDAVRTLMIEELQLVYREELDELKQKCEPLYNDIVSKFNVAIEGAYKPALTADLVLKPHDYVVWCDKKQITSINKTKLNEFAKSNILGELVQHLYPIRLKEMQVYRTFNYLIEPFLYVELNKDENYLKSTSISDITQEFIDYVEKYHTI